MIDFQNRIIDLTSEKIIAEAKAMEIESLLLGFKYSERTQTNLENRLMRQREVVAHLDNNLQINIMMSKQTK